MVGHMTYSTVDYSETVIYSSRSILSFDHMEMQVLNSIQQKLHSSNLQQ